MTVRLDEYAPEWALGIASDLEAGIAPAEALANAAGYLNANAARIALVALKARLAYDRWERMRGEPIGSYAEHAAANERQAAAHGFAVAQSWWHEARLVRRMRGEIVMGSLV